MIKFKKGEKILSLSQNPFYVNQRLEIAPYDSVGYLSSRIEDFKDGNLVIAMPMRNSIPVYLPVGSLIYGKAIADEGMLYSFESNLLEYTMSPIPLWVIQKPANISQIQQRNFFRYDILIPVRYFLLDENDKPIEDSESVVMSKNLSGGGILLTSMTKRLPIGTKMWLEILLDKNDVIKSMAKVTRMGAKISPDGRTFYQVGLQFIDMEEFTVKKIIGFLNKKVLEQRGKGIL